MNDTLKCYGCGSKEHLVFTKVIRKEYRTDQQEVQITSEIAGILCEECLEVSKAGDELLKPSGA
jgi:NMD protein affecting ribosome stability and mRNA decay